MSFQMVFDQALRSLFLVLSRESLSSPSSPATTPRSLSSMLRKFFLSYLSSIALSLRLPLYCCAFGRGCPAQMAYQSKQNLVRIAKGKAGKRKRPDGKLINPCEKPRGCFRFCIIPFRCKSLGDHQLFQNWRECSYPHRWLWFLH